MTNIPSTEPTPLPTQAQAQELDTQEHFQSAINALKKICDEGPNNKTPSHEVIDAAQTLINMNQGSLNYHLAMDRLALDRETIDRTHHKPPTGIAAGTAADIPLFESETNR